jgi:hypothetical protein
MLIYLSSWLSASDFPGSPSREHTADGHDCKSTLRLRFSV